MAGVNLLKQLKRHQSGASSEVSSSGSSQKLLGLDVSSLKDGFSDMSGADKLRLLLMVVGIASIPLVRDQVHEYTVTKETEKRAEIDKVAHELEAEKSKLAALKDLAKEADNFDKQKQELQRKLTIIESLGRNRNAAVKMVDFIVNRMPINLWLGKVNLDLKGDSKVTIAGSAQNLQSVSEFMRELEGAVFFPRWQLEGAEKSDSRGDRTSKTDTSETRSFSLSAKVVPL